ncbi:hypothetical protein SISSUDRAFT_1039868, partial [Sistotremastrum suecicum HHB10207 ss-3]
MGRLMLSLQLQETDRQPTNSTRCSHQSNVQQSESTSGSNAVWSPQEYVSSSHTPQPGPPDPESLLIRRRQDANLDLAAAYRRLQNLRQTFQHLERNRSPVEPSEFTSTISESQLGDLAPFLASEQTTRSRSTTTQDEEWYERTWHQVMSEDASQAFTFDQWSSQIREREQRQSGSSDASTSNPTRTNRPQWRVLAEDLHPVAGSSTIRTRTGLPSSRRRREVLPPLTGRGRESPSAPSTSIPPRQTPETRPRRRSLLEAHLRRSLHQTSTPEPDNAATTRGLRVQHRIAAGANASNNPQSSASGNGGSHYGDTFRRLAAAAASTGTRSLVDDIHRSVRDRLSSPVHSRPLSEDVSQRVLPPPPPDMLEWDTLPLSSPHRNYRITRQLDEDGAEVVHTVSLDSLQDEDTSNQLLRPSSSHEPDTQRLVSLNSLLDSQQPPAVRLPGERPTQIAMGNAFMDEQVERYFQARMSFAQRRPSTSGRQDRSASPHRVRIQGWPMDESDSDNDDEDWNSASWASLTAASMQRDQSLAEEYRPLSPSPRLQPASFTSNPIIHQIPDTVSQPPGQILPLAQPQRAIRVLDGSRLPRGQDVISPTVQN